MRMAWLIEKKRDGHPLSQAEIEFVVRGFTDGTIPDYQMAALAMAVCFRGMSRDELTAFTLAMMESGRVLDLSSLPHPTADKHSTGGVGDKISLVLAPLVASCGVAVPMISGRGLGLTGGTLDKLEAIPGYRTHLSSDEFLSVLRQCGCSLIGQTSELAPADRKLYALRDVTGTVPSIPLIASSILSKKLAEGAGTLVMDVKWGCGAFMGTLDAARELARTLVGIAAAAGRRAAALVTDMNQPLGRTAGNALEVRESIEALRGKGPDDVMALTHALAAEMLVLAGAAPDAQSATDRLQRAIADGSALSRFREMVRLHGGDVSAIDDPDRLPTSACIRPYPAKQVGYIAGARADAIARACVVLGAGRERTTDRVDPAAGVSGIRKIGEPIRAGEPLLFLHGASDSRIAQAASFLEKAFSFTDTPHAIPPLIADRIAEEDVSR
jgi:pyrimidine-nucleoside phosphorylase